ncbi:L-histidine N(alpha)-methyltransferase [Rhodococcus sp. X156]|uniref:L-histidine N(alpha)-methyltransferase n=1 Tax=Rhodococcus sp. X156 TaxID=2499145 RepID=UPI000FD7457E|nr:L-histidine N(alpha)-methyltransferase [Rhodococcus sp. X156]
MTAPHLDVHLSPDAAEQALRRDALVGLTAEPKWLPPKWFYDDRGSELFEEITALPEYYPTRTERALLAEHAGAVAAATGADTLVELGSGSSEKTRLLLDAMQEQGTLRRYVPQDVSRSALAAATAEVAAEYPGVQVQGVVGDFTADLEALPRGNRRMIAFLGGTLGNLVPAERTAFLAAVRAALVDGEHLLLGVGLVTDPQVLVPAYDDAAGVTAEFNRNVLHVLNRELGANFDVDAFEHVAVWDAEQEWIEMRLQATRAMRVHVAELDLDVSFAAGEQLRTEVSAKFRLEGVQAELAAVGLEVAGTWTDPDQRFALLLARAT